MAKFASRRLHDQRRTGVSMLASSARNSLGFYYLPLGEVLGRCFYGCRDQADTKDLSHL